jgi:hypothetical protein
MSDTASQVLPTNDHNRSAKDERNFPGGKEEIRWEVVARTPGYLPATIIAGRLQSEGIPARVWQEGAGRAFAVTVGILGTGHVVVPEEYAQQARNILADEIEAEDDIGTDEEDIR